MCRACQRLIACLLVVLSALMGQAPAFAREMAGEAQRLNWRIMELEGEVAALRQFASQQDASIDRLQARAEASDARARRARAAAGLLVLSCAAVMAWWWVRRRGR